MQLIRVPPFVVEVDERRGGEITRIRHRGRDLLASYDWEFPVGASRSTSYGDPHLDWLSDYRGGWQLLAPNAGAACVVDGVPLPFHGEWSRTKVTVTERSVDRIVMLAGTRLPLLVEREIQVALEPERVLVRTTVRNPSQQVTHFVWGEHPAFAVTDGDEIDLPAGSVFAADGRAVGSWPSIAPGHRLDRVDLDGPKESVHYLTDLREGWAAVRRRDGGVALAWDVGDFPAVWLWHELGSPGFPFYGRTSLVAVEPASSWPGTGLAEAIERGQAMKVGPGGSRTTVVALIPFETSGRRLRSATIAGDLEFGPP